MANLDDEARKLRDRFASVRNKAEWARHHRLRGGASMLSQHIHGHRPISMEAAIVYAKGFGVTLGEISPRLAALQASASTVRQAPPSISAGEPEVGRYGADPVREALEVIHRAARAAPVANQPEIRLRMQAMLEGIEPVTSIARLSELLSAGNSPAAARTRRAA